MEVEAMALEMPVVTGHPNRRGFRGVLTVVGRASDRAPSGARGNRVILTRAATERAMNSLLGMAVDYTPLMDGHDARRKIGVITSAELVGDRVEVSGHLFAHDFPEVVGEIASSYDLGMSYEIADARVCEASRGVWAVTEFAFTGAAVLKREKAAYRETAFGLE
ncbi:hypothetical protein Acid345_4362 [Candidatus Koribacter versatilis Ellin345]|uniref:Uncharacterized protein n=1 Tax=Koribacter versatilis (strain Ellin345) TaxID=204669 RepID=Q1IID8_KORVE|nr:hypothetical protein [Candidatus Koribacter versatilis]ABF43362.1 hypothetical protein Acid345_4362 [Candidatus Koribacter versatilis Ellin345]